MVIVIAQARIRADVIDATFQAAREMVARTRAEPGCIAYDAHQSLTDPQRIVFVERRESQAHVDTHMALPHTQAFLGRVASAVLAAPTIEMFPLG